MDILTIIQKTQKWLASLIYVGLPKIRNLDAVCLHIAETGWVSLEHGWRLGQIPDTEMENFVSEEETLMGRFEYITSNGIKPAWRQCRFKRTKPPSKKKSRKGIEAPSRQCQFKIQKSPKKKISRKNDNSSKSSRQA